MSPLPSFLINTVSYLLPNVASLYISNIASPFTKALGIVCPSMAIYEIALFVLTKMKQPSELATLPSFLMYIALVYRIYYQGYCEDKKHLQTQYRGLVHPVKDALRSTAVYAAMALSAGKTITLSLTSLGNRNGYFLGKSKLL